MTDEPSALARMPSPSAKDADEYDVICATIMASARGRQFLQEFARRNRHADTMQMLAAITRTEDVIRERSGEPYQSFRGELLEMANVIEALAGTVLPAIGAARSSRWPCANACRRSQLSSAAHPGDARRHRRRSDAD